MALTHGTTILQQGRFDMFARRNSVMNSVRFMARDTRRHTQYKRVWLYLHPEEEVLLDRAASMEGETLSTWARTALLKFADQEMHKPAPHESLIKSKRRNENFERRRIVLMSHLEHDKISLAAHRTNSTIGKWATNHLLDLAIGPNRFYVNIMDKVKESERAELKRLIASGKTPKWIVDALKKQKK